MYPQTFCRSWLGIVGTSSEPSPILEAPYLKYITYSCYLTRGDNIEALPYNSTIDYNTLVTLAAVGEVTILLPSHYMHRLLFCYAHNKKSERSMPQIIEGENGYHTLAVATFVLSHGKMSKDYAV